MKSVYSIIVLILMFVSSTAQAGEWSSWFHPAQMQIGAANVLVSKGSNFKQVGGCSSLSWVNFTGNEKVVDRAISTMMFAKTTNRKIRVWLGSCDSSNKYHQVSTINVENNSGDN